MNELSVMDPHEGDLKFTWDPANEAEVQEVKRTFDKMRSKGFYGYRVKKDGTKSEVIREFDPEAAAIIMAPQVAGG